MWRFWVILIFIFYSCKSYDTNTNLEAAYHPVGKEEGSDLDDYIGEVLQKMYPKIGKYKLLIKQKTCIVDFIMGGNIYKVKYDLDGNWLKSEVVIAYDFTLPEYVQKFLKNKDFDGWIIIEKKLHQTPNEIRYKFMFKRGDEIKSIWVSRDGEVLKDKTDTQHLVK